jgi:cytochrome c peroxidase
MIGRALRARACALLLASVTACGGGGGSAGAPPATAAPQPTPTSTPGLSPGAAAYLNLSLSPLANYANPSLPAYYGPAAAQDNTPAGNPVTDAGATLGRVLFWDKRLSVNNTIACASCHVQADGFTSNTPFSTGFLGGLTSFHAMRLANVRYYQAGTMFWDKSAASVEAQVISPIQNSVEMGWDGSNGGLAALEAKMATLPYYPELFAFVYGDPSITTTRVENAVAQFERSIIASNSRWDQGYALVYNPNGPDANLDVDIPTFTAQENRGRHLFMAAPAAGGVGCASCHQPPTFALIPQALSNGLDAGETTVFKAPSLKNIGVTGPYMHDGRFATLAQVVEHYNSGIQPGPSLDPRLQRNGQPVRLNLSADDEAAIVAFLMTLDDQSAQTDPRFADPFKH